MKISVNITDMTPEEARDLLPFVLEKLKNPKVVMHQKDKEVQVEPQQLHEQPAAVEPEPKEAPAAPDPAPAQAPAAEPVPVSRRDAKSAAVRKIQAGHKDEVKALISSYAESGKVDDIPEEQLAEFVANIAKIGA